MSIKGDIKIITIAKSDKHLHELDRLEYNEIMDDGVVYAKGYCTNLNYSLGNDTVRKLGYGLCKDDKEIQVFTKNNEFKTLENFTETNIVPIKETTYYDINYLGDYINQLLSDGWKLKYEL